MGLFKKIALIAFSLILFTIALQELSLVNTSDASYKCPISTNFPPAS